MKIPKTVKIGGYTYSVQYRDTLKETEKSDECCGTCDMQTFEINILKSLKPKQKFSTFLHECIEAYNHIMGMQMKHNQIVQCETMVYDLFSQLTKR